MAPLELLIDDRLVQPASRDHLLFGIGTGYCECHVWPGQLVIDDRQEVGLLLFLRLGFHADLVG